MNRQWDRDKGNYGRKITGGKRFSIFHFQLSIFFAATISAILLSLNFRSALSDVAAESAYVGSACGGAANFPFSIFNFPFKKPHILFPLAVATTDAPFDSACAFLSAQANFADDHGLTASDRATQLRSPICENETAGCERAGQLNLGIAHPTKKHSATDGIKEVRPAALRGGNARASGRRLANCKLEIVDCRLKKELPVILDAAERHQLNADQTAILLAIRKAENGPEGREFGVLHKRAVDTNLATQARWAAATIKKNAERFSKEVRSPKSEVKSKEFIHYLADRYCPKSVDPAGNRHWKKNVGYWAAKF
jgi:hypothetical protein